MSSETKLTKYKDDESVDNTKYRGMIDRKSTSGLHLHGMLLNIMILQETNRTSYLHHRSRIRICRQGVSTSTVDEITSRADNRPPMLEKDMYDSWKIRMELYMMNRQHGRIILESVENGPLIWPTIEENGVTRPKKYSELSAIEAIQADCNVKATNIIL
ncbi:hypothetical protein Tco_1254704 [Tanacetum coccineum]